MTRFFLSIALLAGLAVAEPSVRVFNTAVVPQAGGNPEPQVQVWVGDVDAPDYYHVTVHYRDAKTGEERALSADFRWLPGGIVICVFRIDPALGVPVDATAQGHRFGETY